MPDIIITIGGEAGQCVQTIGEVLSRILIRSGFMFFYSRLSFRIRGGHNRFKFASLINRYKPLVPI